MKRPINKETLIVSAGVAIGLFAIISGFNSGSTGRDAQRLPEAIERMTPGPGDQVLQQSQIFVDFIDGLDELCNTNTGIESYITNEFGSLD